MAKVIRQLKTKKRKKLAEEDINKNSGKEISHTISKIKAHERFYTFILVIIFMVTISVSVFLGLKVDSYQLYDASYYLSSFTLSGELVTLSKKNVMNDIEGLSSKTYTLKYSNHTERDVNFLIRFATDETQKAKCKCDDKIVDYQKIKYSIDGEHVQQFSDETMILSAGMVKSGNSDEFKVKLWLDESLQDIQALVKLHKDILAGVDVKQKIKDLESKGYTKGHLFKGV